MKSQNKKRRKIILLLVVLLAITVGFALLSTTLFINGSSTIKSNTWSIHWDTENNPNVTTGSVTADTPTVTSDSVSFTANFDVPGDYYEFTVDAVNDGTVDGIITQVGTKVYDPSDLDNELTGNAVPTNIIWSVTYADNGQQPARGDILAKRVDATHPTKRTYKVKVQFDPDAESLPADAVSYVYKFEVKYQQYKAPATSPVSVTASKTTASVNEEVTVTVSFNAAAWNLSVDGDLAQINSNNPPFALAGYSNANPAVNEAVSQTYTVDTSTAGTKTITVTGDITDEDEVVTRNISQSVTVTVE